MFIPIESTAKIIEPSKALRKPSTSNPGVTTPANHNNNALITNVKSPSVRMLIGREINCNNGLIKVLIKARIT